MDLETMLPDWDFVAGSTQSRTLTLLKPTGEAYDMQNGVAHLAIVDYVNGGTPVYTKQAALTASDGKYCVVTFALPSSATKELFGRYTYQILLLCSKKRGRFCRPLSLFSHKLVLQLVFFQCTACAPIASGVMRRPLLCATAWA